MLRKTGADMIKQPSSARRRRGQMACLSGRMAEETVIRSYQQAGCALLKQRWRGMAGEIDLILRDGEDLVFVEVKKSSTHALAAQRLQRRQMDRICMSALQFADEIGGGMPMNMRFDAALVDDMGRVELVKNAFGMH